MSARASLLARVLALALASGALPAHACPDKVPFGMQAVTVAESVSVNALGLSILQVQSKEAVAPLFDRIEKAWIDAGYDVRRNQAEGWQVLAALSDKCLTTLQLVDRTGAFGYLAVNKLTTKVARTPALPMPAGARILSTVSSEDDGRRATTLMLSATQSVNALATYYKQSLADDHWAGVKAVGTMGRDGRFSGASVSAQRGRERIEVVIVRDEGSKVVINVATAL